MIRSQKRIVLCSILLLLNVAFIWVNSLLPREISAAFSRMVGRVLNALIFTPNNPIVGGGQGILRKIAHFAEFCTLGLLAGWMTGMFRQKRWEQILLPLVFGVAVACVDETIQCFVPGRGPGFLDVLIDASGVMLGVAVVVIYIYNKQKNSRK